MSNILPAAIAVVMLLVFLGILLLHVPRLDLIVVVAMTAGFAVIDVVKQLRKG